MAFVIDKLNKFGLIDDSVSPATRVYSADVTSEASAAIRTTPERETDPDGAAFFHGFRSEVGFDSVDLDDFSQGETWITGQTPVKMVSVHEDAFIQWVDATRIQNNRQHNIGESSLVRDQYVMVKDGGDLSSHDVYLTRNGLYHLAPVDSNGNLAGGWADTDSNNAPDGYTETNLTGGAFSGGTYAANVNTGGGSDGSLNVTIPFPIDNEEVTLSVEVNTLHDDGTNAIRIEALDASKNVLTNGTSDTSFSSTGRKHADLTTPSGTYFLKCYPIRVTGATAETTKFDIQDPCLRVDGGTSYLQK